MLLAILLLLSEQSNVLADDEMKFHLKAYESAALSALQLFYLGS